MPAVARPRVSAAATTADPIVSARSVDAATGTATAPAMGAPTGGETAAKTGIVVGTEVPEPATVPGLSAGPQKSGTAGGNAMISQRRGPAVPSGVADFATRIASVATAPSVRDGTMTAPAIRSVDQTAIGRRAISATLGAPRAGRNRESDPTALTAPIAPIALIAQPDRPARRAVPADPVATTGMSATSP